MTHHKDKVDVYCFATKHGEDDAVTSTVTKVATYADLSTSTVSHIARMMRDECKIDLLIDLQDGLQDAGWISLQPSQLSFALFHYGSSGDSRTI